MKKPNTNPAETKCQNCDGNGVLTTVQPSPGSRIYGPRCQSCEGSGRIKRVIDWGKRFSVRLPERAYPSRCPSTTRGDMVCRAGFGIRARVEASPEGKKTARTHSL